MKKNVLIILSTVIVATAFTSCSKSYNCHCIYKNNGTITREDDRKINEGKKEKTAASCNQGDNVTSTTLNGYTSVTSTECELTE